MWSVKLGLEGLLVEFDKFMDLFGLDFCIVRLVVFFFCNFIKFLDVKVFVERDDREEV